MNGVGCKKLIVKWVTLVVALVAGLACAAPAQAGWGPPVDISPSVLDETEASGEAKVAALPDGAFVYVWKKPNQDGSASVVTRVTHSDGSLGPINEIVKGSDTGATELSAYYPTIAAGDDGTVRVAWTWEKIFCAPSCEYRYEAQTAMLDDEGKITGSAQSLDAGPPNGWDYIGPVSISIAADGSSLLAWRYADADTNSHRIRMAMGDSGEPVDASETVVNSTESGLENPLTAAASGGGGFVVFPYSQTRLDGAMISADGVPTSAGTLDSESARSYYDSEAFIDSEGIGTVVYKAGDDSTYEQVFMRKMDADGDPLGSGPEMVSEDVDERYSNFYVGGSDIATDGRIAVSWSQNLDESGPYAVRTRTVSADGSLGAMQTVAAPADGYAFQPYVAISPDGGGTVMYGEDSPAGERIMVRDLGDDLAPTGTAEGVGSKQPNSTIFPVDLAYSENGDATALWVDFLGDQFDRAGLRAAFLDITPPVLDIWVQPKAVQNQEIVVGAEASDRSGVTLDWDFGDGGVSNGRYAKHTFTKPGTFDVQVMATDGAGNSTIETEKIEVLAATGPSPPRPIAPDTKITSKPGKKVKAKTATFKFTSSLTGSSFECRLDKAGWTDCKSPKKLKKLKPGKHTFKVRAIKGDLIDPTPASYNWTVKKPAKKAKKGGRK